MSPSEVFVHLFEGLVYYSKKDFNTAIQHTNTSDVSVQSEPSSGKLARTESAQLYEQYTIQFFYMLFL